MQMSSRPGGGRPVYLRALNFVRRVRQTDRTTHTPIIVLLTGCAFESDRQRAFAAECDLFLPKHCPPEGLVSEIRAVGATTPKDAEVIMDRTNQRRTETDVTMPTLVPATMADRDIAVAPTTSTRRVAANKDTMLMTGNGQTENSVARSVSRGGDAVPTRTIPEDGDIVVREETREGTVVYPCTPPQVRTNTCSAPATRRSRKPSYLRSAGMCVCG
jgi:hypothetical protein